MQEENPLGYPKGMIFNQCKSKNSFKEVEYLSPDVIRELSKRFKLTPEALGGFPS
jgi:hypothetical protein